MEKLKKIFRDSTLLEEYVSKIDEACGEEKEFIVTLKYSKRDEAMKKALKKCRMKQNLSGILVKAKYKNKKLSIFKTGKLVIGTFDGKEEAKKFLEELFK